MEGEFDNNNPEHRKQMENFQEDIFWLEQEEKNPGLYENPEWLTEMRNLNGNLPPWHLKTGSPGWRPHPKKTHAIPHPIYIKLKKEHDEKIAAQQRLAEQLVRDQELAAGMQERNPLLPIDPNEHQINLGILDMALGQGAPQYQPVARHYIHGGPVPQVPHGEPVEPPEVDGGGPKRLKRRRSYKRNKTTHRKKSTRKKSSKRKKSTRRKKSSKRLSRKRR